MILTQKRKKEKERKSMIIQISTKQIVLI